MFYLKQYVFYVNLIFFSNKIVDLNACNCYRDENFGNLTCLQCACSGEDENTPSNNCSHFLSISKAPVLTKLPLDILEKNVSRLKTIEITKTGLEHIPQIRSTHVLDTINLEENLIKRIGSNNVVVQAIELSIEYNKLEIVEPWAFNNSRISRISLRGNWNLQSLPEETFYGLDGLKTLDLSETSISKIPSTGLEQLEVLRIIGTKSMKTIPSVYYFKNLAKAELTFPFHCCAFSLPERHDAKKYALFSVFSNLMHPICKIYENQRDNENSVNTEDEEWYDSPVTPTSNSYISFIEIQKHSLFPPLEANISKEQALAFCSSYRYRRKPVDCLPQPDAFNPCEDVMGYKWLRVCVWIVVLIGFMGNASVLVVNASKLREMTVQSLLILNLAFADMCMATFLLLIAIQDLISKNNYFNYAYDWQQGMGCKTAGFLTIFSSQLSIFTLCFLTIERWFTIKKALYAQKLSLLKTIYFVGCGWIFSLLMAALPLSGISSYSTTSLCLPMDVSTIKAKAYVLFLLSVAMLAFIIICVCYYQIYFSLNKETRHKDGEYVLARKMTILVATNFLSWTPITFFALTALFHYPLINIRKSKILLVFFYPLNSCANPFLYAILTTNFKKNFISLLSRFGLCKKSARAYQLIYCQPVNCHNIHRPITADTYF
ncbi:hypothetical protein V9T40_002221 [Parthenolecanium corni]|uniref:G-protein coupled receptors family 1 profile domain-containing protein n=1 Tax=Parthenolecanium corni TaxID=536013 RepID=A0AAN9TFU4_9HEMI